jgi:predicted NAD-dependent protein-ADP-ribosyltransferase YbiA (DUF1768 family)
MDQVIKIYNPRDVPFGQLSNDSIQFMVIDDKRWTTVTNYILSNMLITPLYRIILQVAMTKGNPKKTNIEEKIKKIVANIETKQRRRVLEAELESIRRTVTIDVNLQKMDIYQLYNHYLALEKFENVRTAVEKAYNAKVLENKELADVLLSTENRPIYYISGNPELGLGPDGRGANIIGMTLMQIRHNLRMQIQGERKKDEKDNLEKSILDSYKAYIILQKEMNRGDTLRDYIGKSPQQIVEMFLENNPRESLDSLGLNDSIRGTVIQMYNRRQFPIIAKELKQEGYMVLALRSKGLRQLQEKMESKRIQIIIKLYTEHVIRENNPDMAADQVEKASEQLVSSLYSSVPAGEVPHKYNELQNTVIRLYNKGKLPQDLVKRIDEALAAVIVPDETEIADAEQMKVSYNEEDGSRGSQSEEDGSSGSQSDENSSASSTSTLDEHDPIKQMFTSDEKAHRIFLIQRIQRYTGKASNKYRDWDVEKLETYLKRFEGSQPTHAPREGTGEWIVQVKHKNNRIEVLKTTTDKPVEKDLNKLVKRYNSGSPSKVISRGQLFVKWMPKKPDHKIVRIDEDKNEYQEFPQGFVKEFGPPLEIRPIVDQNDPQFRELSPIFDKPFKVDGLSYPNVSFYITTMLVSQTGKTTDVSKKGVFTRGRSVSKARELLMTGPDTYLDPNQANDVYNKENIQTHRELEETFAKIAMYKKFEDMNLKILLLLTRDAQLVWDDPSDVFLGRGENVAGKILMEIRASIAPIPFPAIGDSGTIVRFMTKDPFMESWIKMRVMDMCNTVYKFKQYLRNVDNQEEEIDPNFVTFVLDKVYQPCSTLVAMSKNVDIPVPEFFIGLMSDCQGMPLQMAKEYEEEFKRIHMEKEQLDNAFHSIHKAAEVKKEFDVIAFAKKQVADMERFLAKNPSPEERVAFEEKQNAQAEKVRLAERIDIQLAGKPSAAKEISFDEKQRREWRDFLETLNEPKIPMKQIQKELNELKAAQQAELLEPVQKSFRERILKKQHQEEKQQIISLTQQEYADEPSEKLLARKIAERMEPLEKKHAQELKKLSKAKDDLGLYVFEKMELAAAHDKARNKLLEKLTEPNLSLLERSRKMEEFGKKQEEERLRFYKKQPVKRTKEETLKYEQNLKEIRERLIVLNGKKKKNILMRDLAIQDISKIYWARIVTMVMFLIQHIKNANEQDIRRAIASIEMLNSEQLSCSNISANLDNDLDNCIASALSNLLVGIQGFKYQYGEHIPLGVYDIDLAGSIILNRDISDKQIEEAIPEDAVEADVEDVYENDFAVEENADSAEENVGDYDEEIQEEERDDIASFGMKRLQPVGNIEQIKIILREIAQKDPSNIESLAQYFMGMINTIKTYKMSPQVRQNRINFFATIR